MDIGATGTTPNNNRYNGEAAQGSLEDTYRQSTVNLNTERSKKEQERLNIDSSRTVYNILEKYMNGDEATKKEFEATPISSEVAAHWQEVLQQDKDQVFKDPGMASQKSNMLKLLRGETTQNNNGDDVNLSTKPAEELQQDPNQPLPDTEGGGETKTNVYTLPKNKSEDQSGTESIDDVFNDAQEFANNGGNKTELNDGNFAPFVNSIYSILLTIGTVAVVIMGAIIGVKYIFASVEGKAEIKSMLLPYVIGTALLYGAFGIWKLAIDIFSGLI